MKITYSKVIEVKHALDNLQNVSFDNGEIALHIAYLGDEVGKLFHDYSVLEMEIVQKHCEKDEDGLPIHDGHGNYKLLPDHREAANKEMVALGNMEVDIEEGLFLRSEWYQSMKLTPTEARALSWVTKQIKK